MNLQLTRIRGFTLIEVALVLSVGALIIIMALVGFSGAARARRDTARTNAAGVLAAAVERYASDNNGTLPTGVASITLTTAMKDPLTKADPANSATVATSTAILFHYQYKCATSTTLSASGQTGFYAISYKQESGTVVCRDNQ